MIYFGKIQFFLPPWI